MGLIVLDARVLIAFSQRGHLHHPQAVQLLASADAQFAVNAVTMAEYLIKPAQLGRDIQADLRRLCQAASIRVVGEAELEAAAAWSVRLARTRAETGLKMPDTIVLATAEALDGQVATFDQTLRAAAQARQRLWEPSLCPQIGPLVSDPNGSPDGSRRV